MANLKFLICLMLTVQSQFAHAKTIALGSKKHSKDFKEYLIKNPAFTSLNNHLLNEKLKKSDSILNEKYRLAVKGLALNDLKPSIFLFEEITDLPSKSFIFSDEKMKLISESYFRLSNLDRSNTDFWISKAIYFNPDYTPSDETFNPSIINKHKVELKKLSSYFYKLKVDNFKPKWSRAFINGHEVGSSLSVHPSSKYNLQVFKEGFKPLKSTLSGEELIKLKNLTMKAYSLGTCSNPKFYDNSLKINVDAVFYSKNCIKLKADQTVIANNQPSLQSFKNDFSKPINKQSTPNKKKSIFSKKKTWYYILGGAVLSGIVVSLSNSEGSKVRPVQHD